MISFRGFHRIVKARLVIIFVRHSNQIQKCSFLMLPCYYPPSASECSANDDNSAVRSKFRRIIILMLISWSENNGEAPTKIHTPHECNLNITTVRQCGSENRLRKKITCTDTPISTVWGFVTECAARRKSANWWPKVFFCKVVKSLAISAYGEDVLRRRVRHNRSNGQYQFDLRLSGTSESVLRRWEPQAITVLELWQYAAR